MKSSFLLVFVIIILLTIISVLGWLLIKKPTSIIDGHIFTTTLQNNKSVDVSTVGTNLIQSLSTRVSVIEPILGATVGEIFTVSGKAPGSWYFEAVFPIQVRDENGEIIGRSYGNSQSYWMTTDLVEFIATVKIESAYKGPADLILLRDNPSGLPEHDDSVTIPIFIR